MIRVDDILVINISLVKLFLAVNWWKFLAVKVLLAALFLIGRRNRAVYQTRKEQIMPTRFAPKDVGELNWAITTTVADFVEDKGLCYQTVNDAVGALECAKLELYRRLVAPYEDEKILENGDVYTEA